MDLQDDRGPVLVYVCIAFLTITWIAVLLRCFVRYHLLKAFKIDDWLLVIAELNFILTLALIFAGVKNGLGKHNLAVPVEPRIEAIKYQAIATITYTVVMAFVKLSIGFFLLRITIEKRYVYTLIGSMCVVATWTIGIFFVNLFQCTPIKYQWDTRIPGSCISPKSYIITTFVYSIASILTDWFYALIPIPMVWPIIQDRRTKILVCLPLLFGVFASVATVVRIKFLSEVLDFSDILFSPTDTMIWTIVEPGIAITAASMATMKPLVNLIASGNVYTSTSGNAVSNSKESSETQFPRKSMSRKVNSLDAEIMVAMSGARSYGQFEASRHLENGRQSDLCPQSPDLVYLTDVEYDTERTKQYEIRRNDSGHLNLEVAGIRSPKLALLRDTSRI